LLDALFVIAPHAFLFWDGPRMSYMRYLTLATLRCLNPNLDIRLYRPSGFAGLREIAWKSGESQDFDYCGPDYTPRLADLARDEADLAICNGEIADGTVTQDLLARSRLHPVCAPGLLPPGRSFAAREIAEFVLLHDEEDGSSWRRWFDLAGVTGVDTSRGPRFLESGLAIEAAIAGQGVALADDFLVADDIAAGRLVQLSDIGLDAADCYYWLRSREDARRRKPVAAFRDWLLRESSALRQPE